MLSPVRAILNTRSARGSLARAQIKREPHSVFLRLNVCDHLVETGDTSKVRELGRERVVSPPLGWLLSQMARDWMDASIDREKKTNEATCRTKNREVLAKLDTLLR